MMSRNSQLVATKAQSIAILCFICLFFYRFGAANLEGFVNYPFWREMGTVISNESFIRLRHLYVWRVYPLLVLPFGFEIISAVALLALGHPKVPRWTIISIVSLLMIALLSTLLIQIPIQNLHTRLGYDRGAFDRLIITDFWLRKLPASLEALLTIRMLWLIIASRDN